MAGEFKLALSQFAAKAGDNADKAVRGVVLEIGSRVVVRSPVDTGRFRSNWFYSRGGPTSDTTAQTGVTSVNGADVVSGKAAGDVFYIQNNLPYAWALERGHSKQAPAGMVGLTVLEFSGIVDQAVREVTK